MFTFYGFTCACHVQILDVQKVKPTFNLGCFIPLYIIYIERKIDIFHAYILLKVKVSLKEVYFILLYTHMFFKCYFRLIRIFLRVLSCIHLCVFMLYTFVCFILCNAHLPHHSHPAQSGDALADGRKVVEKVAAAVSLTEALDLMDVIRNRLQQVFQLHLQMKKMWAEYLNL